MPNVPLSFLTCAGWASTAEPILDANMTTITTITLKRLRMFDHTLLQIWNALDLTSSRAQCLDGAFPVNIWGHQERRDAFMLIMMAGLQGSGKSTLARHLADALPGIVLNKDTIRAALFPPALLE